MDRKRPSRGTPTPKVTRHISPNLQINTVEDIPPELKDLLITNVRENRAAAGPSSGSSSGTPKRKKPLTRRTADAPRPEVVQSSRPLDSPKNFVEKSKPLAPAQIETGSLSMAYSSPAARRAQAAARAQEVESEEEEDDGFDDDDVEWETVDLSSLKNKPQPRNDEPLVLDLSIPETSKPSRNLGRKGPTPAERKLRLEIHKLHLLCLLAHVHLRSTFCNDLDAQNALLPILEKRVVAELNDDSFQQSKVFRQGLSNAAAAFRRRFKTTRPGFRKALWGYVPSSFDSMWGDIPIDIKEFRKAAKKLSGSRDLGTQLFCTLLRRAGLETRLVCSLQPLGWMFKAKYSVDDAKRENMKFLEEDKDDYQTSDEDTDGGPFGTPNKTFGGAGPVRANFRTTPVTPLKTGGFEGPSKAKKKTAKKVRVHDPTLPIYWVEVFDVLNQTWITIDPLGSGIIRNLTTLEPPQWDWENEMSYVVAFDSDNYARDITRKYVKGYNSYTRTLRIEATLDGAKWWKKALRVYKVPSWLAPDRDQFEDGLMNDRLLREGIPKSLAAMRNHPVFAVEEQLRQNEVIDPKVECGKMTGKNKRIIPVYRRQDVKEVKTATKWYMLGREIKAGSQPLKHKKVRKIRRAPDPEDMDLDDLDDMDDEQDTGMYSYEQTILYQPEPCVGPIVPKNAYGNIDLYVPSMLPEGGAHIPHKLARIAADFLGIGDFVADAVTGFDFRSGGKSTPIINGIVVGLESEEAVWLMIEHIEKEQEEEADEIRQLTSLNLWRKFLVALRIKERVDEYALEGEEAVTQEDGESVQSEIADPTESGGFMVGEQPESMTTVANSSFGGGFFTGDMEDLAGEMMRNAAVKSKEKEERRLLEEAKARRAKLTEQELLKVETGEYYDPDAFEGGGFFAEEPAIESDKVDKGKGKENGADMLGGGFFVNEPEPVPKDKGKGKEVDMEFSGGGFFPEETEVPSPHPTKRKRESTGELGGGGFIVDDEPENKGEEVSHDLPPGEEEGDNDMEDDIGDDFEYEDAGWTSE